MSFNRMGSDEGDLGDSSDEASTPQEFEDSSRSDCEASSLSSMKIYIFLLLFGAFVGTMITVCVFYINKKLRNIQKFDSNIHQIEEEEKFYRCDSRGSNANIQVNSSRQGSGRVVKNASFNNGSSSRRMSKTHSLLEQELRRSPLPSNASAGGAGRNNGCLNCKLIIMGESISYADGRCPQCGDDQEQRRMK